jgi:cytochrome c556
MKTLTRITALTGAALLFALAGQTGAADDELTADQVKAKIEAAGFTNVSDIRREEDHFDAKAMKDGKKVILEVDAKTGTITTEYE